MLVRKTDDAAPGVESAGGAPPTPTWSVAAARLIRRELRHWGKVDVPRDGLAGQAHEDRLHPVAVLHHLLAQ